MGHQRERWVLAWALLCSLALGLGVRADALMTGFFSDDFVERAMLQGQYPAARSPLDLFNFVDGSAAEVRALRDRGALPWWSADDLQLSMFRPLASGLVLLDEMLLGTDAGARHVHSALWWALGVVAVLTLLRSLLPLPAVVVATVFFALDEAHTLPLSWLANRGALVALACMVAALQFHVRARERGRVHSGASLALLALGLAAGEWALPFLGYFVAYEGLRGRGALRERARALGGPLALACGYLFARAALGHGTRSSGVYIDVFTQPAAFASASLVRLPVFMADLVLGVPAHHWDFGSPAAVRWLPELADWRPAHLLLGLCAFGLVALGLRWVRHRGTAYGHVAWLGVGALLSLLPMVSSFPTSRLVLPATLGIAALLAAVLVLCVQRLWQRRARAVQVALWLMLAVTLLRVHAVGAALSSRADAGMTRHLAAQSARWMFAAPIAQDRRVVQLAASEHTVALFTPLARATRGHAQPRSFWTLSLADSALTVRRTGARMLELETRGRPFVDTGVERLYRDPSTAFRVGQRIQLVGLEVQILALGDAGQPTRVRFTFERELEHPMYQWVTCTGRGIEPFALPAVGSTVQLPHAGFPGL